MPATTAHPAAPRSALVTQLDCATASFLWPEDPVGWRQDLDARLARIQQHPEPALGFIEEHIRREHKPAQELGGPLTCIKAAAVPRAYSFRV